MSTQLQLFDQPVREGTLLHRNESLIQSKTDLSYPYEGGTSYPNYNPPNPIDPPKYYSTLPPTKRMKKVVKVDIDATIPKVIPLVRKFRERGSYNRDGYESLVRRMCQVCHIPAFLPNYPQFVLDPELYSLRFSRSVYIATFDYKHLVLSRFVDLDQFLGLWYLYLKDRNYGFTSATQRYPGKTSYYPEVKYAKKVLKQAQPIRVRRLRERAFVEEMEV